MARRTSDGFIYEESEGLTEEEERVLKGLHHEQRVDPVTGRKQKRTNLLNKKSLSKHELDEFFLDF